MLNKNEIKYIQSLGLKKNRDEEKMFVAEGPKIVEELLHTLEAKQFHIIYAVEAWVKSNEALTKNINVQTVSIAELERMSHLKTAHSVLALIRQSEQKRPVDFSFALYLDTIQDPGNLGTIIRIADWFGIKDIVCTAGCADVYSPKVVQSTMASLARVNIYYDKTGSWLKEQKVPVYAATLDGISLYELKPADRGILVIGNESKGISDEILQYATNRITIPRKGGAESLNAAVATGIILSHLV